jgi:hypothetical protein
MLTHTIDGSIAVAVAVAVAEKLHAARPNV